jgi:hypothetical protein
MACCRWARTAGRRWNVVDGEESFSPHATYDLPPTQPRPLFEDAEIACGICGSEACAACRPCAPRVYVGKRGNLDSRKRDRRTAGVGAPVLLPLRLRGLLRGMRFPRWARARRSSPFQSPSLLRRASCSPLRVCVDVCRFCVSAAAAYVGTARTRTIDSRAS